MVVVVVAWSSNRVDGISWQEGALRSSNHKQSRVLVHAHDDASVVDALHVVRLIVLRLQLDLVLIALVGSERLGQQRRRQIVFQLALRDHGGRPILKIVVANAVLRQRGTRGIQAATAAT